MKRQNNRILKEELPRSVGVQYATGDRKRNTSRRNEGMEPKQKQYPVVDMTGDRSKAQSCNKQYCIGTWNVRFMNQGKLEAVKRDGKGERRHSRNQWTRMGDFKSDNHYIYYCGQESLRRNGVAIMVNKRIFNAVLGCNPKATDWSLFISKANHSISQLSKPMPQPVTLKKLKLNGPMKTYKSF